MPAEGDNYYNQYWTASSKSGSVQQAAYPGEAAGTAGSDTSSAQLLDADSVASYDRRPGQSVDGLWQSALVRGPSNPFADSRPARTASRAQPFNETGNQWPEASKWSQLNGGNTAGDQGPNDVGGTYINRVYPGRDDSYRSHDTTTWQDQRGARERQATAAHSTPAAQETESAYAKLGNRTHSGYGYGTYVSHDAAYENVTDAGPVRRGAERLQQGNSASPHWNDSSPSARRRAGAYAPLPVGAQTGARPESCQQLDTDSMYSEDNRGAGRSGGGAATAARSRWQQTVPNGHWQPPSGASNGSRSAADIAEAAVPVERLAADYSSYRTLDSADLDYGDLSRPQRRRATPPQMAPTTEYDEEVARNWSRPVGPGQAPDASSVTTGVSDLLGPPGYGQLFEAAYFSSRLQPRAVLSGSKVSLDSQSQDAQWRSPDLSEVIDLLSHGNIAVLKNAAAYLQHLCFNNNGTKAKARSLGGVRVLAELLHGCDVVDVQRVVCGCLLNLTRGRENDEAKRELRDCNGIEALARLLRKSADSDVRELATGILWNLSSSKALKRPVIDAALTVLVNTVVIPHSGWDPRRPSDDERMPDVYWSTVFRNGSGTLRNVSSDGFYARKKLRECTGLIESLLCIVKAAIGKNDMDNKSVENCVCILRNLSYRLMEIDYPDYYDKEVALARKSTPSINSPAPSVLSSCLKRSSKKSSQAAAANKSKYPSRTPLGNGRGEQLWQSDVVSIYLPLLADCSNPDTLEAAIGALQNLTACEWQPAVDLREKIRKEKGLPIVVELLGLEADSVVCAAVIALRNLAVDSRNKELIGKYAIQPLLTKLPPRVPSMREQRFSEQTVCAVVITLQEIVKDNVEHASTIATEGDGMARLMTMAKSQGKYEARTLACVRQLLATLWKFSALRPTYKKKGWKEADFTSKTMHPRSTDASQASLVSGLQARISTRTDDDVRSDARLASPLPYAAAVPAHTQMLALHATRPASAVASESRLHSPGEGYNIGYEGSHGVEAAASRPHWSAPTAHHSGADSREPLYAKVDRRRASPLLEEEEEELRQLRRLQIDLGGGYGGRPAGPVAHQQYGAGSNGSTAARITLARSTDSDLAAADSWV